MEPKVLEAVQQSPAFQAFLKGSNDVGNLTPMEEALFLAAAFQLDGKTRIVVKKNRYEAQQLYRRLSQLSEDAIYFSMEESLRVQAIASSPEERISAVSALVDMSEGKARLVVTDTAGFLRNLPDADFFRSQIFEIQPGLEMDMGELKKRLNRAGYGKVQYVEKPGEYASRGGIVDIFPSDAVHPVRIEFFDTEVDTVREFDEQTQRTIHSLPSVRIAPATDLLFSDAQIDEITKAVREKLDKEKADLNEEDAAFLEDYVEADLRALETYDGKPSLYWYYPYTKAGQLLDYIDGQVILSSTEDVYNAEKNLNKDNIAFIQEMVSEHKALPRYMLFNDLVQLEKGRKFQEVHNFISYENPLETGIFPLEPLTGSLPEFLAGLPKGTLISVDDEGKRRLESYGAKQLEFIGPDFYEGFKIGNLEVYTERELLHRQPKVQRYRRTFKEGQVLQNVLELEKGDYVVHGTYGIGQYLGITTREVNGRPQDYLHIAYKGGDELFVPLSQFQLVRKYVSKEGAGVQLSQLGSKKWQKTREKVSKKVEEIAGRLVELYSERSENIGYAFPPDDALQEEFDSNFPYEPTHDQLRAIDEIKEEMEKPKPMDHLLCGDVGFGKTEVAMRAAFKAISAGKQVAVLCPTTILSMQHAKTFQNRFEYTGANIALLNRFTPPAEQRKILKDLEEGKIDILIGTHKLFNKSVKYKDLGFLIIDEEQRFGVEQKERIKELKNSIDVLSLSATPIPRTLQMSLIGVRTISQLNTPPAHRHPVQTYVLEKKGAIVEEVIQRELARDGQVFYLYNHIDQIFKVAKDLEKRFPDAKIAVAHGRMSRDQIEQTMADFADGKYQILVCTTIIETGLDIANANTILIEDADHYGLAQLYQIRGRVGRREKIAYCYLMVQPDHELTEQASKRLKSIKEFTQLGSGYKIAMRDLTIRGAGDMLGPQQAGFIDQVGMDLYLEMLKEAIERKLGKVPEKKEPEKSAQVQFGGYIPQVFSDNDGDKLRLYQDIKMAENEKELLSLEDRVRDLFGRIPSQVDELFDQKRLDFFVNRPEVESVREKDGRITITMNKEWSSSVDGIALFDGIGKISKNLRLAFHGGKIIISLDKKNRYVNTLMSAVHFIEGMQTPHLQA